jgi:subtilase family serine protease
VRKRLRVAAAIVAPVAVVAGVVIAGQPAAGAEPLVPVPHNVNPALAHSQRTGALDASKSLSGAIALNLHNRADLDKFLAAVNNPHSAQYHHFLTPAQFAAKYAPTQADVDKVTSFLSSRGLTVTGVSGNRQAVDFKGSVKQVQSTFHTNLAAYTDTTTKKAYFANETAPQLPRDVADVVSAVVGLNNHVTRTHQTVTPNKKHKKAAPSGYGPAELNGAYDTAPLNADGTGQNVAVWEFDGYQADNISTYDQQFGLNSAAPTTVSVDGADYDSSPGEGQIEVELDIEVINAIAPAASISVYEAPNSDAGETDMANQIVSDAKVNTVSISWGACEAARDPAEMTAVDQAFAQGAAQGIGWYSASGDDGSADCTRSTGDTGDAVDFPASSPSVTGVGGTTLDAASGGETAWDGSGGGVSTVFPKPDYQTGDGDKRTVPDVSSDADPNTGYAIFSAGQWGTVGGTSAAAPMWAGFSALYGDATGSPLGMANAALYGTGGTGFKDVTEGSNGSFQAGPGYDEVTGLGSYDANALTTALSGSGG